MSLNGYLYSALLSHFCSKRHFGMPWPFIRGGFSCVAAVSSLAWQSLFAVAVAGADTEYNLNTPQE